MIDMYCHTTLHHMQQCTPVPTQAQLPISTLVHVTEGLLYLSLNLTGVLDGGEDEVQMVRDELLVGGLSHNNADALVQEILQTNRIHKTQKCPCYLKDSSKHTIS